MLRDYLTRHSFLLSVTCLSLVLVFSLLMLNRSFAIGAIVGILFLLFTHQKIRLSKVAMILSVFAVIALTLFLSIYIESDSSLGRLLIYKVSAKMFLEHPFSGIGWGAFQKEYNLHQALFFKSGNYTQKEFLLADNTFYAFNDYWQFIVEMGIIGGLCLLMSLLLIIALIRTRLKNNANDPFLKLLVAIALMVCVAAFFTHVFEHKPFQVVMLCMLAYMILYDRIKRLRPQIRACALTAIPVVLSLAIYLNEIRNIDNYQKLEQAKLLSATGYVNESISILEKLYPTLRDDVGFLKTYSETLSGRSMTRRKTSLLREILAQYSDNSTFLKLGLAYKELGRFKQAEAAFLQSVYMVPNRFVPREALYQFYLRNKQYEQASYWRKIILTMSVKIPSERIEAIKQTMNQ
ncbi:hypothetical protein EZ428_20175 [Pedobacter frigiditerrae]|uniref:O-antigen ligase-related domain-containing protein n=1 Tax=Pedobacter frigiditerrae TaxID=2530452 RepID=A0A4R0MP83_9SPHI|nr:O-antigen ligase family protein [Pedobacter frigiditerrae]TCC88042.1 hypothetical protein EZ428_20175 [Pedobacter frigiditerrae]